MELPVIPTPVFPRWVWMEEVTLSHIPIATLITSFMLLAPILEWIGYRKRDLRYDRLSRSMIFFCLILFSPGAALGTGIPMFIIGLYPEFWSRWANIFFWPLIAQFVFFTLEVIFLFFFYYLPWDRMQHRKRLHITFGFIAALWGELIQLVWDSIGSYMLTPNVAFPAVNEAVGFSLAGFFNPSFPYLFFHRTFGNFSWTLLIAGGVFAIKYMRARVPTEKAYFGWASDITFTLGFIFFFAQPFIGWGYAQILQTHAPVAFHSIMGGHTWYYFIPKMGLIVLFTFIAGTYVFVRHRDKFVLLGSLTGGLLLFLGIFHLHPPLDWLGSSATWRLIGSVVFLGFIGYLWTVRVRTNLVTFRGWQVFLLVGGLAALLAFAAGGNVRERARSPYTVYATLMKPEATVEQSDRFVVYENCIECHHWSENDLKLPEGETWQERVARERLRPDASITDDEAKQIVRYLERYHND